MQNLKPQGIQNPKQPQQAIYFHSVNFAETIYAMPLGFTTQVYAFSKAEAPEVAEAKVRDYYISKYGIVPTKIDTSRARNQREESYISIIL